MLNQKLVDMINQQINLEWYSAYLYLQIHCYYSDQNLEGFEHWFLVQTQEERDHAMLFMQYLQNNGGKVVFSDVVSDLMNFENFREPLTASLVHEELVTASINEIYAYAYEIKDFRTMQFLDWFVKEQSEEEKNSDDNIKKYDLFGSDPRGLYLLDQELKQRIYSAPSLVL
ncbi:MAG: ferritin [Lachnospiraceae bacterium]